jgi:hypothetical protein
MPKDLEIDVNNLEYGLEMFEQIANFTPYSSYSFQLTQQGHDAVSEVNVLAEWGMGNNMLKMKEAALEVLESIMECSPGERVNMNLTEYEGKSMGAVVDLIGRSLKNQKDGVLRK